jgi:uncharacterized protein (TIGR00730 family)
MKKRFSVAVFCGASIGKNPVYAADATKMGRLIAENGWRMIYGHGATGLMGKVMDAALAAGGDIYGVSEKMVATFEKPSRHVKGETAPTIQARKRRMFDLSDAFVILPGGIGTLDELDDLLVENALVSRSNAARSGAAKKSRAARKHSIIVLVNTNGYWDKYVGVLKNVMREGFASSSDLESFFIVKTPKAAIDLLKKQC